MARMNIKGTKELVGKLRKAQDVLLPELEAPVEQAAQDALAMSKPFVPRSTGALEASGYTEPAHIDTSAKVVSASCGYDHPHAAEVHEGVHGQFEKAQAPRFLRKGAKAARSKFRRALLEKVNAVLSSIFGTSSK